MIDVTMHPIRPSFSGYKDYRWTVTLDGSVIVKAARDPEHQAARALQALGHTGPFRTLGIDGKERMRFHDIATTAARSVRDGKMGLSNTRWKPFAGVPSPLESV